MQWSSNCFSGALKSTPFPILGILCLENGRRLGMYCTNGRTRWLVEKTEAGLSGQTSFLAGS